MILPLDPHPGPNPNSDANLKPEPHPEPHPDQVLQFATGAARLPSDVEMAQGWTFSIQASTSFPTIEPTPSNGLTEPAMCARASTCSKTIYLPPYDGMDALQRGLDCSLMDGGFGTA